MSRESSRVAPLLRRLTSQPTIAVGGFVLGIIALAFSAWPHEADVIVNVLRVVGTALVAASLSMLLATVSSREAVQQQNAKDAHLRAKKDSYSPLYTELQALRRRLEAAQNGQAAYPSGIDVGDSEPTPPPSYYLPLLPELSFTSWEDSQPDVRELDFTPHAARLLDGVVQRAREYNATMEHAREATIPILAAHIRTARQTLREALTPDGNRLWLTFEANFRDRQNRPIHVSEPPLENAWYEALLDENSPNQLAVTWITGVFYSPNGSPRTLGWLLAKRIDQAAAAALRVFPTTGSPFSKAPVEWVRGVLDDALSDISAGADYAHVWTAFDALLRDVQAAEAMVLAVLRDIRQQYEGGPPRI